MGDSDDSGHRRTAGILLEALRGAGCLTPSQAARPRIAEAQHDFYRQNFHQVVDSELRETIRRANSMFWSRIARLGSC